MRGRKTEGSPCDKCGSTVRYVYVPTRNKEGNCVSCASDASDNQRIKLKADRKLSKKDIYNKYFNEGKGAPFNANCPYFMSNPKDADKRLAWCAGYNDHHAGS